MNEVELLAFEEFLSQHDSCPDGQKWSSRYHKWVDKASVKKKTRKRRKEEHVANGDVIRPSNVTFQKFYDSKAKLENLCRNGFRLPPEVVRSKRKRDSRSSSSAIQAPPTDLASIRENFPVG